MSKTKVLHIAESYGGGVTAAIHSYVKHSPHCEHFLFATIRVDDATGEETRDLFSEQRLVSRSLSSLLELRRWMRDLDPNVVHLHSSFAGGVGRLLPFIARSKIVYTPHGYAFFRNSARWKQSLYRSLEQLLLKRTAVVAGCGEHETLSAKQLGATHALTLTNICEPIDNSVHSISAPIRTKPRIVMLGRVSEQKGYRYFAKVAKFLEGKAQFVWIGGGETEGCRVLSQAGVEVSGWLSREQALLQLSQSDLYLHTAAWDGFPISVLEAAELQIPIMLRAIGPFTSEGLDCFFDVESAMDGVKSWLEAQTKARDLALENLNLIQQQHTAERLQSDLKLLYQEFSNA
ncbi:glycosyltransferase [Alginatibacterium sediminis]|uniref:Glycosyltransferase n=1 Tax=Alginatibacterium sediminis TaxID=2164068 RepID=A0A420E5Z7_9ALTE|nr:glycosyltransferase [Alginatibacterium sediminis]RKF13223.1 glycosyltransferase [Alginatibacterium sediminis]